MCRVFMCTAGTSGERRCATSEIPLAQKRGSSEAPGTSLRNSGENSPYTVDMLTPTFSKTRPCMIEIVPPPPPCRSHFVRSKRPAALSAGRSCAYSSSIDSKVVQIRSRNSANQLSALVQWSRSGEKAAEKSLTATETLRFDAAPRSERWRRQGQRSAIGQTDARGSPRGRRQRDAPPRVRPLSRAREGLYPGRKSKAVECHRSRCCHQDQPGPRIMIGEKGFPRDMSPNRKFCRVIQGRTPDAPVVEQEPAWLD